MDNLHNVKIITRENVNVFITGANRGIGLAQTKSLWKKEI